MTLDADRRSRLLTAKARALVADHLGVDSSALATAPAAGGAAVRGTDALWVLLEDVGGLGAAFAVAERERLPLQVLAEPLDDAGLPVASVLARRSAQFRDAPVVWTIDGRRLVPARPAPVDAPVEPSAAVRELIPVLVDAGVDVTIEHGAVRGEVRGLEIARIVEVEGGARIEVGVGRHDREAFTMVHGDLPTPEALRSVIGSVDAVRRAEAEAHPLRRLAPEGWLRSQVIARPELVGATALRAAEPPLPRDSVKDVAASIAVGSDAAGGVVVACSVGIDLDVVPTAADARVLLDPTARLVVLVPERDAHPHTVRLAARLREPAGVVTVAGDWRAEVGS